jgi:hypothetical protein
LAASVAAGSAAPEVVGDLSVQLHSQLLHDSTEGVVAELVDADDPVESPIGETEVEGRSSGFGGDA